MGIRVFDLGKRVEKTRGVQAPDVRTRRVHGTVFVGKWKHKHDGLLTLYFRAILTYPYTVQLVVRIS